MCASLRRLPTHQDVGQRLKLYNLIGTFSWRCFIVLRARSFAENNQIPLSPKNQDQLVMFFGLFASCVQSPGHNILVFVGWGYLAKVKFISREERLEWSTSEKRVQQMGGIMCSADRWRKVVNPIS
jgi:hypothetical protein